MANLPPMDKNGWDRPRAGKATPQWLAAGLSR